VLDNTASLYSVNSLTGYLKSLGLKAPKPAVSDYLEWFEDAYFLFTVQVFDASLAPENQPQEDLLYRPRPSDLGLVGCQYLTATRAAGA
jgi:hypothetical protein